MGIPIVGGLVKDILGGVGGLIGKFIKDPNQALQAQIELAKIESDAQQKADDVDARFAEAQAAVLQAEAKSESWLTRNWRPLVMLDFASIITYQYVVVPVFHLTPVPLAPEMWSLLQVGISGYLIGRSVEKVVPQAVQAYAAKQQSTGK